MLEDLAVVGIVDIGLISRIIEDRDIVSLDDLIGAWIPKLVALGSCAKTY